MTRQKAIRLKCIDCCGGQANEVRLCTAFKCPLWEYRMGATSKALKESANADAKKAAGVDQKVL